MRLFLLSLVTTILLGCATTSQPESPDNKASDSEKVGRLKLHFISVVDDHYSSVESKKTVLVNTYDESVKMWEAIWGHPAPKNYKPAPASIVLSSEEAIVATFMGEQMTGGYSTRITGLWLNSKTQLEVQVEERHPRPGALLTQALTYPYHVVKLEKCCLGKFKRFDGKPVLSDFTMKMRPIKVVVGKEGDH